MRNRNMERWILWWIGFFLGRVSMLGLNPLAVAGFASLFFTGNGKAVPNGRVVSWICDNRSRRQESIRNMTCVFLGIATVSPVWSCIRYAVLTAVLGIVFYWIRLKENQRMKKGIIAGLVLFFVSSTVVFLPDGIQMFLAKDVKETLFLYLLEMVLTVVLTVVFSTGIHYLKWGGQYHENITGFAFLLAAAVNGFFDVSWKWFSLPYAAAFFFLLYIGYCYGSAAGAVSGVFLAGISCLMELAGTSSLFAAGKNETDMLGQIGIFAVCGLAAGIFRKGGTLPCAVLFAALETGAEIYIQGTSRIGVFTALAFSAVMFLALPGKYKRRVSYGREETEEFQNQLYRDRVALRVHDMAEAFHGLYRTFAEIVADREREEAGRSGKFYKELLSKTCEDCPGRERCSSPDGLESWEKGLPLYMEGVLDRAVCEGKCLTMEDMPLVFLQKCCNVEKYLETANEEIFRERIGRFWKSQLKENRSAVLEQFCELAQIVTDFEEEISKEQEFAIEMKEELRRTLAKRKVELLEAVSVVGRERQKEIYLRVQSRSGHLMACRELASLVGQVYAHPFRLMDGNRNVIFRKPQLVSLVEEVNYKVITGISRCAKTGEIVSGDNFSSLSTEKGQYLLSISDGMGSGEQANEESRSVLDLLEQFLEAGFDVEAAIRLINSVMLFRSSRETFSTLDISLINLYTGTCKFVKSGGAATYIRRERVVERIDSASFPIGMWENFEIDTVTKKLYDGDMVVMVSDGIIDAIEKGAYEEKESAATCEEAGGRTDILQKQLLEWKTQNPQELSEKIMELALAADSRKQDDMTVMVSGIWNR